MLHEQELEDEDWRLKELLQELEERLVVDEQDVE